MLHCTLQGSITVQSANHSPDFLIHRVNEFVNEFKKTVIDVLTDEKVEMIKAALIAIKIRKDLHIGEETNRYMDEIKSGKYDFLKQEHEVEALRQVTKEQVKVAFQDLFFDLSKRLNVKIYSKERFEDKKQDELDLNMKYYKEMVGVESVERLTDPRLFKLESNFYPKL